MSMRYLAGFISAFYNPLKVPDAPTIGTATTSSTTSVSITFTAPANVGGGAITSYIATAKKTSDGTVVSATGASSPITVTGLTAVPYTVTVAAVNSFGPSLSSAASNSITPALPAIGAAFEGGFYAGQISTAGNGIADYNIVIGPVASAQNTSKQWKTTGTDTPGTNSVIDGPANSAAMNDASHPAAQYCEGLSVGGYSDWYMPAKNEMEVCYYNFKPTTQANNTTTGTNTNAVPSRGSNYTAGNPAQTSVSAFISGGAEAFGAAGIYYWTSTQNSSNLAWLSTFYDGNIFGNGKYTYRRVRAMRRVAV